MLAGLSTGSVYFLTVPSDHTVAILEILAKVAILAILSIILAILANLKFINTSASQSSGG